MGDTDDRLARVEARLAALEDENRQLRGRMADPEGTGGRSGRDGSLDRGSGGERRERVPRRDLLTKGAVAAGAAAATAVVGGASPAAAADGETMFAGRVMSANRVTRLDGTGATPPNQGESLFVVSDNGFRRRSGFSAAGLEAVADGKRFSTGLNVDGHFLGIQVLSFLHGMTINAGGSGLTVDAQGRGAQITSRETGLSASTTGNAQVAISAFADKDGSVGVSANAKTAVRAATSWASGYGVRSEVTGPSAFAVHGTSTRGAGLWGRGATYGVVGQSTTTNAEESAVYGSALTGRIYAGTTDTGQCMFLQSESGGGVEIRARQYHLRLANSDPRGAPTSDTVRHERGDIVETTTGDLWLCVTAGTPGTWRKLGGPATAGAFHVLATPMRAYDSRPGGVPTTVGPKTPLPGRNVARTLDLKAGGTGVPAGATAVMVNLLLTNAATGNGNFTVWANGVAKPQSNTLVWGGSAGRFSTLAVTRVDGQARCQVDASLSTHIVVDVVGYYR